MKKHHAIAPVIADLIQKHGLQTLLDALAEHCETQAQLIDDDCLDTDLARRWRHLAKMIHDGVYYICRKGGIAAA